MLDLHPRPDLSRRGPHVASGPTVRQRLRLRDARLSFCRAVVQCMGGCCVVRRCGQEQGRSGGQEEQGDKDGLRCVRVWQSRQVQIEYGHGGSGCYYLVSFPLLDGP